MNEMYQKIEFLCKNKDVDITTMCKEAKISRAILSEFKMGRTKKLSTDTLSKLSKYFGVSLDYLLGNEQKEKPAAHSDEHKSCKPKLRSVCRLESSEISEDEDESIAEFIDFLLSKRKGDK